MDQQSTSVLIVEDEQNIRTFTANALREEGLQCDCVADAPSAMRHLENKPYDLAIIDLRLPGQNGHSLASTLLQAEKAPWIVVLTAVCEPRLVKDLYARGVNDIIFKPVNYSAFAAKIKAVLERRDQQSRLASTKRPRKIQKKAESSIDICTIEKHLRAMQTNQSDLFHWFSIIDPEQLPEPGVEQIEFARSIYASSPESNEEHREMPCLLHVISVTAAEINRNGQIIGKPFKLLIRSLSLVGISFIHQEQIESKFLGVSWISTTGDRLTAIVEVLRCQSGEKYFSIGGRFAETTS